MTESQLVQLRKGVLEYCILAQIADAPKYGLELAKQLSQYGNLLANEGNLYPILSRLRKLGWVTSMWVEAPAGPPRRYYGITADGRAALKTFQETWLTFAKDATDALAVAQDRAPSAT